MSSRDPRCGHAQDAAAYVLRALEEHEADAFASHLEQCDVCQREVSELSPVVDLLAASPPPERAPHDLGQRLMVVVRGEAELLNASGASADRPASRPRRRWSLAPLRPLTVLAAAATLALGIGVGLAVTGAGTPVHQTRAVVAATGASAVLRQTGDRSELLIAHMPAPANGRIYELWVQRAGASPRATDALFAVDRAGNASVDVPVSLRGVKRLMVTSEPAGGSLTPTGAPLLTVAPAHT